MKTRVLALLSSIIISAAVIAGIGSYIKFNILQPLELDDNYNVMELPFQVLTDDGLKFAIEYAISLKDAEPSDPDDSTFPVTVPSSGPDTTDPLPSTTAPTGPDATVPTDPDATAPSEPATEPTQPQPTLPQPTQPQPTQPQPTLPKPTEPQPTEPDNKESYSYPGHDFSNGAVSDGWFDSVLFIGESRTVGLRDYARSGNAEYFCAVGMSVFNVRDKGCSDSGRFPKQTLESLLSSKTYQYIFINLGINECGYPGKTVAASYKDLIEMVQEKQPDATIILQGVLTVTEKYAGSKKHFHPANIQSLNEMIKAMADNSTIYYIDANPYFTDPNGYLYTDITGDGCHFTGRYYKVWSEWIRYAVGQLGI